MMRVRAAVARSPDVAISTTPRTSLALRLRVSTIPHRPSEVAR